MSALFTSPNAPKAPRNETALRETGDYAEAQKIVDRLSDAGFDVKHVRILGTGLRTVEQVTGRLTTGRAALLGAVSGAWFGLLVGVIFSLFSVGTPWYTVLIGAVLLGAGWGMIFGAIGHWATRGSRDFSSVRGMEATNYVVMVDTTHHADALRLVGPQ